MQNSQSQSNEINNSADYGKLAAKELKASSKMKSAFVGSALAAALVFGSPAEGMAQTPKNSDATKAKTEVLDQSNPLDFVSLNVGKYYPDMESHRNNIKDKFYSKEQKDSTEQFLKETVMKASTPDQKVAGVLVCLENSVMIAQDISQDFSNNHADDVTNETLEITEEFDKLYSAWIRGYNARLIEDLANMRKELEIMKEEIAKDKEEIAKSINNITNMMNSYTIEQVKMNNNTKETVIGVISFFKEKGIEVSPHMEELFNAAQ